MSNNLTSGTIIYMQRVFTQYFAFILLVSIAILPFQSLSAASVHCADMNMTSTVDTLSMVMADHSSENVKMDCCEDGNCASTHCSTNPIAIHIDITFPSNTYKNRYQTVNSFSSLDLTLTTLFRPPRA